MRTMGFFSKDDADGYIGHIHTLLYQGKAAILPTGNNRRYKCDFQVFADGVQIGEGWNVTTKKDGVHLSIVLDDPSFSHTISCQLLDERYDSYRLVWSRP
jgi:uncharacterized protein (DUF736 family)